ncbi:MAG: hypothetical protein ABEJ31_14980 [Haloarculaceae archaeon]
MTDVADPDGLAWLLNVGIFLVSALLSLLTALTWRRERDRKLLVVTLAYFLFALRGVAALLSPFVELSLEGPEAHPVVVAVAELFTHLSPLLVLTGLVLFFVAFTRS